MNCNENVTMFQNLKKYEVILVKRLVPRSSDYFKVKLGADMARVRTKSIEKRQNTRFIYSVQKM